MGFLGGIGGIILGVGIGQIANFGLSLLATRLGGKPFEAFITPLWFVGLILASSSLIGLISGFWPARRASFLSPKEAFVEINFSAVIIHLLKLIKDGWHFMSPQIDSQKAVELCLGASCRDRTYGPCNVNAMLCH